MEPIFRKNDPKQSAFKASRDGAVSGVVSVVMTIVAILVAVGVMSEEQAAVIGTTLPEILSALAPLVALVGGGSTVVTGLVRFFMDFNKVRYW